MPTYKLIDKLASRVQVGDVVIGDDSCAWLAGPCAIEDNGVPEKTAASLASAGVGVFRGGLFKPRTSPYDFQGLGEAGIEIIKRIKAEHNLAFVTEVIDEESLQIVAPIADMLQIGSRNALNYSLLKLVGKVGKPILLKRGYASTIAEWLGAAEYLATAGAKEVVLCERGIRTMTEVTRFSLDVGAIAWLRANFPMPIVADPSHAAGCVALVKPLALAARAAGAQGMLVETNSMPQQALCDKNQQLPIEDFISLKREVDALSEEK